jgi:hypothetical protein
VAQKSDHLIVLHVKPAVADIGLEIYPKFLAVKRYEGIAIRVAQLTLNQLMTLRILVGFLLSLQVVSIRDSALAVSMNALIGGGSSGVRPMLF